MVAPSGACEDVIDDLLSVGEKTRGEDDVDDVRDGVRASPVALQLTRERDPTDGLGAGLDDALETSSVCFG
jgi:hypothetical protein